MDSTETTDIPGRQSRRELVATIDHQKEQLSRYEARLKDVVRAYKGLAKEKEALEKSVAVLGKSQNANTENLSNQSKPQIKDETGSQSGTPTRVGVSSEISNDRKGETSDESDKSSRQSPTANDLSVLQDSLSTLTAEKSRLINVYQEEKKKMKHEKIELENINRKLIKELDEMKSKFKLETEDLKSKWIVERHNRDKESNDSTLMLRELQKLVGEERAGRERLESELQEARDKLKGLEMAGSYNEEYEKRVRTLELESKQKNEEISRLLRKCQETPPELISLRKEAEDMQMGHKRDLERAETRAANAEHQSNVVRASNEKRVVNLESRLHELSETVGTYDRLRQQDQTAIQRLKDRLHQLEAEKSTLLLSSPSCPSSATSSPAPESSIKTEKNDDGDQDSNLDVQTLLDRILRLKTLLRDANQRSESPIENLEDILYEGSNASKWKKTAHLYKEELEKIKKESKGRHNNYVHGYPSLARSDHEGAAQDDVVLSLQEDSPSKTRLQLMDSETKVIKLKEEIGCMKEQMRKLKGDLIISQNEVATLKEHEEYWKHEISKLKDKAREAQATAEVDLKNRILSLEEELKKQRDRCITIIEEKEDEVQMLKSNMETTLEAAFRAAANTAARSVLAKESLQQTPLDFVDQNFMPTDCNVEDTSIKRNRNELSPLSVAANEFSDTELSDKQRKSSIHGPGKTKSGFTGRDQVTKDLTATCSQQAEGMVLFYEEELSHKDAEIKELRSKCRDLESSLRDLQMHFIAKEEKYTDQIDVLRERVSTLQRMTTKEGANLEYLKNVVLTYMLTAAATEREHMLKAIAAVLMFSKEELTKVRHYNAAWWWNEKAKSSAGAGSNV